ncbi:homeobox protein notochord [Callospermophilus lateralis]|uniref:homeobox protein notochord n=1 Tax=Callospermophilus lateralis TaxID=76772 RepID=UPI0040386010
MPWSNQSDSPTTRHVTARISSVRAADSNLPGCSDGFRSLVRTDLEDPAGAARVGGWGPRPALSRPAKFKSSRLQLRLYFQGKSRSSPPGQAMPSPGQLGRPLLTGLGTQVQPLRDSGSPVPASPALSGCMAGPGTPQSTGRLESSFSVEAILAKPDARAPVTSPPPVSSCAALGFWTAPSHSPAPVLPWACPATWLPAYLRVGVYPLCPQPAVPGLRMAHFCGFQGLGVTGLEVAHCPGLWGSPHWTPSEDLQDTERHQKRVRTMFNLEQLEELEKVFAKQHNLVGKKRAQLAARLHLTENQVRIWFQNRRVKYQKQQKLKLPAMSAMATSLDEPSSSSDSSIQSEDVESGVDS